MYLSKKHHFNRYFEDQNATLIYAKTLIIHTGRDLTKFIQQIMYFSSLLTVPYSEIQGLVGASRR